jgi:hypothetical protein
LYHAHDDVAKQLVELDKNSHFMAHEVGLGAMQLPPSVGQLWVKANTPGQSGMHCAAAEIHLQLDMMLLPHQSGHNVAP